MCRPVPAEIAPHLSGGQPTTNLPKPDYPNPRSPPWREGRGVLDPDRALRGLRARAETGDWDSQAWEGLLWAAHQKGEVQFQQELADTLLQAPNLAIKPFLAAAVAWLQQRREVLWSS